MGMVSEVREHLTQKIIPFWEGLRDDAYGGYYGYLSYDLKLDKQAVKGCILNSRITWFFANAYLLLGDERLLREARHAYEFLRDVCYDREFGGVFWSMTYDGQIEDSTKHTYNQAFAIYALSSYYDASGDKQALELAYELFDIIEAKCTDEIGYLEAFNREFKPAENDKLSENGVMADKTMNTLLHVFEGYTELYRVDHSEKVAKRLRFIMDTFADKVYNPALHRQEVFFDANYNTILDLYSYGHDIETAWLMDRGVEILGDKAYMDKMHPITRDLTANVYKVAFDGRSLSNECDRGVVDTTRVWWVQAETVLGFLNGYEKIPDKKEYLQAAMDEWEYIRTYIVDPRPGSEWYSEVDINNQPSTVKEIVEPWKCPYHNGRMCFEVIRRGEALGLD